MNDQLDKELQRAGSDLAKAWSNPLTALAERWQEQIPDWNRVFPGLVASIGIQSLLWPRWLELVSAPGSGESGSAIDTGYVAPPAATGSEVYRFACGHAGGSVAWMVAGLPGTLDWDRLRPPFAERDVFICLSSLTTENHVFMSGKAPGLLAPIVGRTLPGDQPVGLPVCDCDAVIPMLPEWQTSLKPLEPVLASAASAFRSARPDPAACPDEAATTAFGRIVWCAWQALLDAGVIRLTGGPAVVNKSLLGRLFGARELAPFRGAMLFRGDHWALWERIREVAATGSCSLQMGAQLKWRRRSVTS